MLTSQVTAPNTVHNAPAPYVLIGEEENLDPTEKAFLAYSSSMNFRIQQATKRLFDFTGACLGLLVILPMLLLIAFIIRLDSNGPVLYKSKRIGRNGVPFYMYKFRTMSIDADAQRDALREQANLQGALFKIKNDPRVTRVGQILRALSLDELPQLINVLRGEMSLVGPRPLPPDESELFQSPYTLRFQVYPGITGAWQVSGRSNLSFDQLCLLEIDYVLQWTLLSDFKILLQTFPAVLASRGAY